MNNDGQMVYRGLETLLRSADEIEALYDEIDRLTAENSKLRADFQKFVDHSIKCSQEASSGWINAILSGKLKVVKEE